jgi:hypothetical protein
MIANPTTMPKWIQCGQLTVSEMVEQIQVRYETLDPRRKYMFIEWLQAHSDRVKTAVRVCEGLTAWLEAMQHENLRWEFRLIMDEIDWWGNLDEESLTRMVLSDLARNGA